MAGRLRATEWMTGTSRILKNRTICHPLERVKVSSQLSNSSSSIISRLITGLRCPNKVSLKLSIMRVEVDYSNFNLNKLSTEEIARHKKKMDKVFDKNLIKPNDPGFIYDKRIQFKTPAEVEESWE